MSDNKVKTPLEEYLDDISDLIDEGKFKDIYMTRHPFNQELTILLNEEGINLLEEIPEINDEKVAEFVEEWFDDYDLSSEQLIELKKELYIENMPGDKLKDISISFYDENYEYECVH